MRRKKEPEGLHSFPCNMGKLLFVAFPLEGKPIEHLPQSERKTSMRGKAKADQNTSAEESPVNSTTCPAKGETSG